MILPSLHFHSNTFFSFEYFQTISPTSENPRLAYSPIRLSSILIAESQGRVAFADLPPFFAFVKDGPGGPSTCSRASFSMIAPRLALPAILWSRGGDSIYNWNALYESKPPAVRLRFYFVFLCPPILDYNLVLTSWPAHNLRILFMSPLRTC